MHQPIQVDDQNTILHHAPSAFSNNTLHYPTQDNSQNNLQYHAPSAISHSTLPALAPPPMQDNSQNALHYKPAKAISHSTPPALPPPSMQDNSQNTLHYQPTRAISHPRRSEILGYQSTATGRCYSHPISSASSIDLRSQRNATVYDEKYFCTLCDVEFKNEKRLRRHNINIHDGLYQKERGVKRSHRLSCDSCYTDFQSERALLRHLKNIHGVFKFNSDEPTEENKRVKRNEYQRYQM